MKTKITELLASASKIATIAREKIASRWEKISTSAKRKWASFKPKLTLFFKNWKAWLKRTKERVMKKIKNVSFGTKLMGGMLVGVLALSTAVAALTDPLMISGQPLNFGWFTFFMGTAYVILSFDWANPIDADEIAVRSLFGRPVDILEAGLPFVPKPFFKIERLRATVIQREFPAEPEDIFDGDMDSPLGIPEGKKPPIRITFRNSITEDEVVRILGDDAVVSEIHKIEPSILEGKDEWSDYTDGDFDELEKLSNGQVPKVTFKPGAPDDGLARRVTEKVIPVVRWRIKDAIAFVKNIGSEEEANKQIEDEMVSSLQKLLPNMSLGQAMENLPWISTHLHARVIRRTRNWGIQIEGAYIKQIPIHHALNKSISEAASAEFIGRTDKELAIKRGEGNAQAARNLIEETLFGQAAGQKKIAEDLGITGAEVMSAEVVREMAKGGNAIIFGADGMAQAAGVLGAMVNKGKHLPPPEA